MEIGPQNHKGDGLLGLNFIVVVYMDPLGNKKRKLAFFWLALRTLNFLGFLYQL